MASFTETPLFQLPLGICKGALLLMEKNLFCRAEFKTDGDFKNFICEMLQAGGAVRPAPASGALSSASRCRMHGVVLRDTVPPF